MSLLKRKLAFMAVVNKVKGFVRNVVGVPPLTLPNAVGEDLVDYKIYGNSKQSGTPSPEAPVEIVSVGDRTINLFDEGNFINMLIEAETAGSRKPIYETIDGKEYFRLYGTNCSYKDANGELLTNLRYSFKENTQYTVSFDYVDVKVTGTDGVTRVGILLYIYYTDGSVKDFLINSGSRPDKAHVSFTTQADKTVDYVRFSYGTGMAYTYFANFQIAESSEEKEYEPFGYKVPIKVNGLAHNIYLTEPLRKVDEYADYIDFSNGCVVRKLDEMVFDGTENWLNNGNDAVYLAWMNKDGSYTYNGVPNCISTHLPNANTVLEGEIYFRPTSSGLRIYRKGTGQKYTDNEGFKAFLAEEYAKGNPVTLITPYLDTAIKTEPIELPKIPTAKGTTTLTVETTTQPSNMDVTYYSSI